ncbi:hypothetical protein [Pedobacter cryophilus]|nr:hypothetical protein [Pedobacter cryophilus]
MRINSQTIMSQEIYNFSLQIDEQFEIIESPAKNIFALFLRLFK